MFTQTTHNPVYGPQGQTCRVRVYGTQFPETPLAEGWFFTQAEALAARDNALDAGMGLRAKVDGLPTIAAGC